MLLSNHVTYTHSLSYHYFYYVRAIQTEKCNSVRIRRKTYAIIDSVCNEGCDLSVVRSMTGFGRGVTTLDQHQLTIEIRSVNHRFLEISTKFPKDWMESEVAVKKLITDKVFRGKFDVVLTLKEMQQSVQKIAINWPLLKAYVEAKEELAKTVAVEEKWTMQEIAMLDQVLTVEKSELAHEQLLDAVLKAAMEALDKLIEMRQFEGQQLKFDMLQNKALLEQQFAIIQENCEEAVEKYRQKLIQRIEEYVTSDHLEERLLTEVALFAERIDIAEELTRLQSHLSQLEQTLSLEEPIGRKLDFLMQEIHREINTIGSKNQSAICSKAVVEAKSILEKMREQVQNIE